MHFVEAKSILSNQNSMNIYRGCLHGCIYCDSRSDCYQMKHDFNDIEVKINAAELLEDKLKRKRNKCMICTGSMTDPYIPIENNLKLTRKCLEIINDYGFGASIITKSDLVLRDLDLIKSINEKAKFVLQMTLTTYDEDLCKILEPNVSSTKDRFKVLKIMEENNIPTIVWLSPILPFINDTKENINGILDYCIDAKVKGIICFNMSLTLRDGNREYYYKMLDKYFPGLKEKYIKTYGNRYELISKNNHELMHIFKERCRINNILSEYNQCFDYINYFPDKGIQTSLF